MPSKPNKKATRKTYTEQARAINARIKRAEANNTFDLILAAEQMRIEALAVWDAIRVGAPDFIINALVTVIEAAARSKGLPAPTYAEDKTETRAQAIEKIEHILHSARHFKPATPTLAQMIVAVIEHDDCPQEVLDALNGATSDLFNRLNDGTKKVYFTAPYIHALIEESKVQEGGAN
jgi:hypothetical protein